MKSKFWNLDAAQQIREAAVAAEFPVRPLPQPDANAASIPPKAAVQDEKHQQGAQAGAEPLRALTDERINEIERALPRDWFLTEGGCLDFARAILRAALAEPQAEPRKPT